MKPSERIKEILEEKEEELRKIGVLPDSETAYIGAILQYLDEQANQK